MFMFYKMYTLYQVPGTLLCTGTIVLPGTWSVLLSQRSTKNGLAGPKLTVPAPVMFTVKLQK